MMSRVEPAIVFRGPTGRSYAVVSWVVAGVVLVAFTVNGGLSEVVAFGAFPLLLAVAGWAAFWRPQVRVTRDGVRVVNVLSTTWLPWTAITGTRTRWGLELTTHHRPVGAWALPARSAVGRVTSRNREWPSLPPLERLERVVPGGGDPEVAAALVEAHRTGDAALAAGAAPRAEHRLDPLPAALLLVSAALVALTLLR